MDRARAVVPLDCSEIEAERLLPRYFAAHRDASGKTLLRLRLPLGDFGIPGRLDVSRAVVARICKRRDEQNLNDEFGIHWKPADGGPFPEFSGRLTIWSEEDPERSFMEIDGTYEPPLGTVVGAAFDAAVGRSIAVRTAQALLEDIRAGIDMLRHEAP